MELSELFGDLCANFAVWGAEIPLEVVRFVVADVSRFCERSALSENSLTIDRLLFVFFFCPGAVVQGGSTTYNGRIVERYDLTANKRPGVISL